jgi:hypothetical protein
VPARAAACSRSRRMFWASRREQQRLGPAMMLSTEACVLANSWRCALGSASCDVRREHIPCCNGQRCFLTRCLPATRTRAESSSCPQLSHVLYFGIFGKTSPLLLRPKKLEMTAVVKKHAGMICTLRNVNMKILIIILRCKHCKVTLNVRV